MTDAEILAKDRGSWCGMEINSLTRAGLLELIDMLLVAASVSHEDEHEDERSLEQRVQDLEDRMP